jgi:hypothetical protein
MRSAALLLGLIWTSPVSAELLVNGNFETSDYTGWVTTVQTGSGGSLFIDTPGTTTPVAEIPTAPNPRGGLYYSVTDQGGPGTYSLTQLFTVPVGTTALMLSFDMFVNNYGEGVFIDSAGLDFSTAAINQHARVDLLTAGADPFSTAAGDVLQNFYLGADAGPNPNPYTAYSFDIFSLITPGQSYQIRFAEVDNLNFFNLGVDNVSISAPTGAVPEPASWSLMLTGFGIIGFSLRRFRRPVRDPRVNRGVKTAFRSGD